MYAPTIMAILVLPSAMAITAITAKNGHMAVMAMADGNSNMAIMGILWKSIEKLTVLISAQKDNPFKSYSSLNFLLKGSGDNESLAY